MAEPQTSSTGDAQKKNGGIVNYVKDSATAQLTTQKDRGTDALGRVAEAVRSSTQKLREERHDTIAGYVDKAADQIENWSRRLRDKDVNELVSDVQRLARRQPAIFIGSAFALGLVGARFLKSSRPQSHENQYNYGGESRRTRYGGSTGPTTVHDYTDRTRDGDAVVASEVSIQDVPIEPATSPSGTSGAEAGTRSTRGRRSTLRTEQS
jgi:hypothetical protein